MHRWAIAVSRKYPTYNKHGERSIPSWFYYCLECEYSLPVNVGPPALTLEDLQPGCPVRDSDMIPKLYQQFYDINALVEGFFKDKTKTAEWWRTPNPLLGQITPAVYLFDWNKGDKLFDFVKTQLAENVRDGESVALTDKQKAAVLDRVVSFLCGCNRQGPCSLCNVEAYSKPDDLYTALIATITKGK